MPILAASALSSGSTEPKPAFGLAGAVVLHLAVAGLLVVAAFVHPQKKADWGDTTASKGAVQASMVSAIPLPPKAPPVEKSVLAEEHNTPAPEPPPKVKEEPPPKPNDVLVKAKVDPKVPVKPATKPTPDPPKHPQPVPDTPKATSGAAATQLAMSTTAVKNGTAAADIPDRAFGARYAYYRDIVSRKIAQNWYTFEADPRSSQGKKVAITIEIGTDGNITETHVESKSGSASLDTSALHALQRIDTFGPLPSGDHLTVELSFDYHQP